MTPTPESLAVAQYLSDHPEFFNEHASLLLKVKLPSPVIGKAVSLQERQIEIMREKYRNLELRLTELTAFAEENREIVSKYKLWVKSLLVARDDVDLPFALTDGIKHIFDVPDATVRLWGVREEEAHKWFAADVNEDVRLFANSLSAPYCGTNQDFQVANWLEMSDMVESIAMLPLRLDDTYAAFGILVMGSPNQNRFTSSMATDFLVDIGETASAALSCLLE